MIGIGGFIPDCNGQVLFLFHQIVEIHPIFIVELMQLSKVVRLLYLWRFEISEVEAIKNSKHPWSTKIHLIRIWNELEKLDKWGISHPWREANQPAGHLVKVGINASGVE